MPKYRLMMRGENFLLDRDGQLEEMGFFTTLWVEADSVEDAELKGVQILRDREDLKEVASNNEHDNPPKLFLEEAWLLDDDEPLQEAGGYSWWPAEEPDKKWWQFWK